MKKYHPFSEQIVDILVRKVNNDNRHFFRILTGYYLSKLTYENIDARVQSKVSFESDYFIIGEFNHTFYNFNQSINNIINFFSTL